MGGFRLKSSQKGEVFSLTLWWRRPLSYSISYSYHLRSKSMDWFLYDNALCHERVNRSIQVTLGQNIFLFLEEKLGQVLNQKINMWHKANFVWSVRVYISHLLYFKFISQSIFSLCYHLREVWLVWIKVFKNRPIKVCGRQPLKNFIWSILDCLDPYVFSYPLPLLLQSNL